MDTKAKKTIRLKQVTTEKNTDYYLEVKSPDKAMKEAGMKSQFEKRFEEQLQKIHTAIHRKGGIKQLDKFISASAGQKKNILLWGNIILLK